MYMAAKNPKTKIPKQLLTMYGKKNNNKIALAPIKSMYIQK